MCFDEIVATSGLDEVRKDINKEARYIIDQNGEYQQIFDVSELMEAEAKKQPVQKALTDER